MRTSELGALSQAAVALPCEWAAATCDSGACFNGRGGTRPAARRRAELMKAILAQPAAVAGVQILENNRTGAVIASKSPIRRSTAQVETLVAATPR